MYVNVTEESYVNAYQGGDLSLNDSVHTLADEAVNVVAQLLLHKGVDVAPYLQHDLPHDVVPG